MQEPRVLALSSQACLAGGPWVYPLKWQLPAEWDGSDGWLPVGPSWLRDKLEGLGARSRAGPLTCRLEDSRVAQAVA